MYRLSQFVMEESRRDQDYDLTMNGERMVQATVLRGSLRPVVFDVGANVGDWTASLLQLAPCNLTVYAFEPCVSTFKQLQNRINRELWSNVIPVHRGCSSADGTANMIIKFDGCSGNSIIRDSDEHAFVVDNSAEPPESLRSARFETIELTSVDLYSASQRIEHIDLLKIDAEGHDFDVILGATAMLGRKAIGVLQFEYNWRWIGSRHYLRDVFRLVRPLGYAIAKITTDGIEVYPEWRRELETYQGGNFVACTEEWLARFTCLTPTWLIDS